MQKTKNRKTLIRILYIGNNFTEKSQYHSTLITLSNLLVSEGYELTITSSKQNKTLRLADMCWSVIGNRKKADYILIDTFSTSNFYFAFLTSQIARILNLKYIPILHGGNLPSRLNKSPNMSKMIFNYSYANVAPSNYLKSAFEKAGYKTHFIPNTIKIKDYQFKKRTIVNPKILWVRAFDRTYNPQMAVKVLQLLKKDFSEASLTMVGPVKDNSFELTKQLISELNLKDDINITGALSKNEWHKLSVDFDIFINTTNVDNTPLSVIEAMALGMPIISTNVGGLPFLIDNEVDGVLVDKDDVDGMKNAIVDLLNNPSKAIDLAMNARNKVEEFDWSQVKNKWFNLLQ